MPCQPYRDALIEAAASGAEPQGDLISHLAACDDCRAALEQEQSLFASIDAGVHVAANAEVPASLLPRVRARLDEAAAPERLWFQPWVLATASVTLALAIFLSARPHTEPNSQANDGPHSLVSPSVTRAGTQNSSASGQVASSTSNESQTLVHPTLLRPVASSQPEVLVPPDEREALSRFVAVLGERGEVALALGRPAPQTKAEPASVEPLQINGLEIKLLEERQTDVSDGAEQKQ